MLYLCLVMDHISVVCSNSPPDAEEPPCSVTLIRWAKSSPISFLATLALRRLNDEPRWRKRGMGRLTTLWQVSQRASRLQRFVSKAFGTEWVTSAEISSYTPCRFVILPNWTCCFWTLSKVVYFLCGRLAYCELRGQPKENMFDLIAKLSK